MSTEENKAIVRRLWEDGVNKRNFAAFDELFAPDFVLRRAATGWQATETRGPEVYGNGAKVWVAAFPDLLFTIEQLIAEGDTVTSIFTLSGTHLGDWPRGPNGVIKATGRRVNLPDIVVDRIADGKIVEEWESLNHGSLWQQLGAIPSPAEARS